MKKLLLLTILLCSSLLCQAQKERPILGDEQTAHFKMPGCNVTVEALYQGGNGDIDNPSGGGSSNVVTGIAAVALTGAAVWRIYEAGTGLYRVLNMPGVPMPSNRADGEELQRHR